MTTEQLKEEGEEKRLSLGEHLEELRLRVIICIIALVICFIISWFFKSQILWIAKRPHSLTMESLGLSATLKVLSYQEGFFAYLKLCLISALFLSYPMALYQAWKFVSVGLYGHERRYIKMFLPFSMGAFVLGGLFGYFILIPLALQFLIRILGPDIEPIITISQYISLVFLLTLALGLVFQLPLLMLLLNRIGFIKADDYVRWRKFAILGAFILAALITPTADPFTQTGTALPIMALYEVGILLARPTRKGFLYAGGLAGAILLLILGAYAYLTLPPVGEVQKTMGVVEALPKVKHDTTPVKLYKGTTLLTAKSSSAKLALRGGGYIYKGEGATLYINESSKVVFLGQQSVEVVEGELFVALQEGKGPFAINTTSCTISFEGGEINIKVLANTTTITCVKGRAVVTIGEEKKEVLGGRQLKVSPGGEPVEVEKVIEWVKRVEKGVN